MISNKMNMWMSAILLLSGMLLSANTNAIEKVTYLHVDALGSPIAGSDAAGNLLWKEDYHPYGEPIRWETNDQRQLYTAQPYDDDLKLSYYGARWYDPAVGRFMGIDPAAVDPENIYSFNRYAYANNNPYRYVDPDGRVPVDYLVDGISVAASTAIYANEPSIMNGIALGVDIVLAVIPYVPSGIGIIRGGDKLVDASKAAKSGSIWSSTKKKSAVENAFGHWKKHKSEFPELQNSKQYVEKATDFLRNPPKGTLTKTNSRGDTLRYDPNSNTFGVLSKDGAPRTMFRPKDGMNYWNKQ